MNKAEALRKCVTRGQSEASAHRRRMSWLAALDAGCTEQQIADRTGYSKSNIHLEVTRAKAEKS